MNDKTIVSHYLSGKLCNNVLQTYRCFWFARIHGIPFSNVITGTGTFSHHRIFDTVRRHLIDNGAFLQIKFNLVHNCAPRTFNPRQELFDLNVTENDNVSFLHGSFTYPELPWEHALFATLFDNEPLRKRVSEEYATVLSGNTVGYTVRRTDMLGYHIYRELPEDFITADFRTIIARYRGMVRIVCATDEPPFVQGILDRNPDIAKHVFILAADEDTTIYTLSLCDTVIGNGQLQCSWAWANDPHTIYESTFGQVAQILNRSYKYRFLADPYMDPNDFAPGRVLTDLDRAMIDLKMREARANPLCRIGCHTYPVYIP